MLVTKGKTHSAGGSRSFPLLGGVVGRADFRGPNNCYRYLLTREWHGRFSGGAFLFIGMNPSTASAELDDMTIRIEQNIVASRGLSVYWKCNISPYRCTHPGMMHFSKEALVPDDHEDFVCDLVEQAAFVILDSGEPPPIIREAGMKLFKKLAATGKTLYVLNTTKSGWPRHPRALPKVDAFRTWSVPEAWNTLL